MAVRRFWRRIDLRWVNLALLALCGLIALLWWDTLRWSAGELPRLARGEIGAPDERYLYRRARRLIEGGGDLEQARELLERSIAVDPHSNAVYWLAECYRAQGKPDAALAEYERFIGFDPTRVEAYLGASGILEARGRDSFRSRYERLRPRLDPEVPMKYNRKAISVYAYHEQAIERLTEELLRLGSQEDG